MKRKTSSFDFENTPASDKRPVFNYIPLDISAAPVVSIVTPFFNTGAVFYETAHSVFHQSLQQWEWIIVNDGSTEPVALEILNVFRAKDSRVRIIDHESNRGPGAARNTGFKNAQTDFVVQLDSDDLLEPTALEKWRWFLECHPQYSSVGGYTVTFNDLEFVWTHGFHSGRTLLKENTVANTSMLRKQAHDQAEGYDESLRSGLEDWDFWIRFANAGLWGSTVPERLNWYRSRKNPVERWSAWDGGQAQRTFIADRRRKYPKLWNGYFPEIPQSWHLAFDAIPDKQPFDNLLQKSKPRLLMLLPWLALGGSDRFNLDLVQQLTARGWEITIATTMSGENAWLDEFASHTPDIFISNHFLRLVDYPRFLQYLIESRNADAVLISNSELGYLLLPFLRENFPGLTIVDFCHSEETWKNGGYPRHAVDYQSLLDKTIVSSRHLKEWMELRGADAEKINIVYTGIDTTLVKPDLARGLDARNSLHIRPGHMVILYAARLVEGKQPRVFAKVMTNLQKLGVRFVALVAGDGPLLPWLESYINLHLLGGHVQLLGAMPNNDVRELLQASDVFFLPTQMEGIAVSIYEAMATGLPVVSARVGGQAELVTPECGLLIERADEEAEVAAYTEALLQMATNPQERRNMGNAGRQRVEEDFTIENMAEGILSQLEKARQTSRSVLATGIAQASTALAIEYTRVFYLAEHLWYEREQGLKASEGSFRLPSRKGLYSKLHQKFLPWYEEGLSNNWGWLRTVKNILKIMLNGR